MGRHADGTTGWTAPAGRVLRLDVGRVAALVPVTLLATCVAAVAVTGSDGASAASTEPSSERLAVPHVPERHVASPGSVTVPDRTGPFTPLPSAGPGAPAAGSALASGGGDAGTGIPARALTAYRHAERLLDAADPACRLDWSLVAAIGMVESHHGSYAGNTLGADGVARPGIIGIPLTGAGGTAHIGDSDGGAWDGDVTYDRAVGPMQFIPGTWRITGADAEPDGSRNPQDIDDAAASTGVYLCSGSGDLTTASDRYAAVFRYNHSDDYVRKVLAIADGYARGVNVVGGGSAGSGSGSRGSSDGAARQPSSVMTPVPPASAGPRPGAGSDAGQPPAPAAPAPAGSPTGAPVQPQAGGTPGTGPGAAVGGLVGGAVGTPPASPLPAPSTTASPSPTCVDLLGVPVLCPTAPAPAPLP